MGLSGSLAGSLAGRAGGSFARAARGPLDIFDPSTIRWWSNADNRVEGTPPDVTTVTNLADPTRGNATQGTESARPHLLVVNGRNMIDHTPNERMSAESIAPPLLASGEVGAKVYWAGRMNTLANSSMITFGNGVSNSGMRFFFSATQVRATWNAGGTATSKNHAYTDTGLHSYATGLYNTEINIEIDGTDVGSPQAKSGTITNDWDTVTLSGNQPQTGVFSDMTWKEAFLYVGPEPTAAQNTEAHAYMMSRLGI